MNSANTLTTPRMAVTLVALAAVALTPVGVGAQRGSPAPAGGQSGAAAARPAAEQAAGAARQRLRFGPCPEDVIPTHPRLECAPLTVPLDYRKPRGRQIEIVVSRIRTAKPELRIGSLMLNSGGPGFPFLGMPAYFFGIVPQEVKDRFDLVTFDSRFAGHSKPVLTCGLNITLPEQGLPMPLPGGVRANARIAKDIADQCKRVAGDVIPHITAENDARDMDRIRAALGEPKLSYLGYGIGGVDLGAAYATLFPRRTDRIILDSAPNPTKMGHEFFRTWDETVEDSWHSFAIYAAGHHDTLGLGETPDEVTANLHKLRRQLDRRPLRLPEGSRGMYEPVLTGNAITDIIFVAISFSMRFPEFAQFFKAARERDVPRLTELTPKFVDALMINENTFLMALSHDCTQPGWPRDIGTYAKDVRESRKRFPIFQGTGSNVWPCAFWPERAEKAPTIGGPGPAANILVPQLLRDPYAVYRGGPAMRKAFGDRARLITVDAGGHGVYLLAGSSCADDIVNHFFLTGQVPPTDIFCPAGGVWPPPENPVPDGIAGMRASAVAGR